MECCCAGGGPALSAPSTPLLPAPTTDGAARAWLRRAARLVQWALPLATLALIPKCPACVGAYVLLFTGIGLSFSGAAALRWGLIALSAAALAWLVVRAVRRVVSSVPR